MEHSEMSYDKTRPNAIALIIFLVLFILTLSVVIVGVFYLTKTTTDITKIEGLKEIQTPYDVKQLREYEHKMLNEYGVVDAEKGVYRIPIDQAMDKVIKNYRK